MAKERGNVIFKTSLVGIISNVFLVVFKAAIGLMANSISIVLDALNNLTDAVSSIITIVGNYLSGKSPDKKHPFGHGRLEYLSTLAIAVIIIYAGVTAFIESVKSIFEKKTPEYNHIMLLILGVAVLVKIFLGLFFIRKGKGVNSGALVASGKDALFDAIISVATIVAAVVYMIFKIRLEAYLGILISIMIIKSGIGTLVETVSKILGEGASVDLVKKVKKTIVDHEGVNGAYDLVFNNYGEENYVASVHVEVDDTMTANEIDILTRKVCEDVHREHNVLLTAVGIYSNNTTDSDAVAIREDIRKKVLGHEHVNQMHGFYLNRDEKKLRFDMVVSFDEKNRKGLYETVIADLKKDYGDYEIIAGIDVDFNEI